MNIHHQIDNKLQYDFLRHTVRKRKRFSKWGKKETSEHAADIKAYYGVSEEKAYQMISLLSVDQLATIRQLVSKGESLSEYLHLINKALMVNLRMSYRGRK